MAAQLGGKSAGEEFDPQSPAPPSPPRDRFQSGPDLGRATASATLREQSAGSVRDRTDIVAL